jgi:hypothetical protein
MRAFPLLSDAYAAVLVGTESEKSESEGDESNRLTSPATRPATSLLPDGDEDLETAPTRPLRLDQIHL